MLIFHSCCMCCIHTYCVYVYICIYISLEFKQYYKTTYEHNVSFGRTTILLIVVLLLMGTSPIPGHLQLVVVRPAISHHHYLATLPAPGHLQMVVVRSVRLRLYGRVQTTAQFVQRVSQVELL